MAVKHSTVDLTVTAKDLTVEGVSHSSNSGRRNLRVQNSGSSEVFLGDSTVSSTSYGILLAAGAVTSFDIGTDDEIYAAVAPVASPGVAAGQVRLLHVGI